MSYRITTGIEIHSTVSQVKNRYFLGPKNQILWQKPFLLNINELFGQQTYPSYCKKECLCYILRKSVNNRDCGYILVHAFCILYMHLNQDNHLSTSLFLWKFINVLKGNQCLDCYIGLKHLQKYWKKQSSFYWFSFPWFIFESFNWCVVGSPYPISA